MRVSKILDKIKYLGEVMPNIEMNTVILNALLEEWGNFTSSIYGKKESTPFQDLWSLCNI